MPGILEINRIEDLAQVHLAWQALLAKTPGASFFQSLPWLEAYWRHFGAGQKLRIILVKRRSEICGILPLVVQKETTKAGTLRTLTYPLRDWGSFYGPLGADPSATLLAAFRHLSLSRRDWDLLDLRWVDKARFDRGRTPMALLATGLEYREHPWREIGLVDLRGSWEEYLASRSPKFRGNVRRLERNLLALGDISFERYRPRGAAEGDADPREDLYQECVELARRSWQGSSDNGNTLSHPEVSEFLRETHVLAARAGALDLAVLRRRGQVIAFGYGYHWHGTVLGLRTGYDPDYAKFGLGRVLTTFTLRDSFSRGDQLFDFGPGSLEVKLPWLTRLATSYRYTHYPLGSLRAQVLRLKHWLIPPAQQFLERRTLSQRALA